MSVRALRVAWVNRERTFRFQYSFRYSFQSLPLQMFVWWEIGTRSVRCQAAAERPVMDILAWWKKHQTTWGKAKELAQIHGIILFPLVPISNTSKESGEESGRGAVAVMPAMTESSVHNSAHPAFAHTHWPGMPALCKRQRSLTVQPCMVSINLSLSVSMTAC